MRPTNIRLALLIVFAWLSPYAYAAGNAVAVAVASSDAPLPSWLMPVLSAAGLWLFSVCVAGLNKVIRERDTKKQAVSPTLRLIASALNAGAGNLDKTVEQKDIAVGVAAPRPADPAADKDPGDAGGLKP